MSDIAIRTENLSKAYRIGEDRGGYRTLRDTITKTFCATLPRLGRGLQISNPNPISESIWALKDISLEVKRGEVVGIIGRNGAGKTTLLKILSRITEPSEGWAEVRGRIGSLLEVGTGFHPELTGRENIYLNGAILGMRKTEINQKFDEIVAFAEIDKFIDTPVKRYSSGMYVRLAFAVAAHLEPEILLVDEVLAVGDAVFQKKCLGKIGDVANEGRTVLFVSHNMGAVRTMCDRVFLLSDGKIAAEGNPGQVISDYLSSGMAPFSNDGGQIFWADGNGPSSGQEISLQGIRLVGPSGKPQSTFEVEKAIRVEIYEVKRSLRGFRFVLQVLTQEGEIAFAGTDHSFRNSEELPGRYRSVCIIPGGILNKRNYLIRVHCGMPGVRVLIPGREYLSFSVSGAGNQGSYFPEQWPGIVCPKLRWYVEKNPSPGE